MRSLVKWVIYIYTKFNNVCDTYDLCRGLALPNPYINCMYRKDYLIWYKYRLPTLRGIVSSKTCSFPVSLTLALTAAIAFSNRKGLVFDGTKPKNW